MARTIGLDIGSHSIKLVGVEMTSKGPFLTHVGIKEIPYGEQREDPGFVSEVLRALYKEADLKPGRVNLSLSGADIHIRRISLPTMPKSELREAVRWELRNHLPFAVESAQIDFHLLREFSEKDLRKLDLIAAACPKNLIDRAIAIAEAAGLKPVHISVGPFALWNLLLALGHLEKEGTTALVELGAGRTGLYLFQDGNLQFAREITPGGIDFTRAVMEGIGEEGDPKRLYDQAERIKYEMGISPKVSYERLSDAPQDRSKIPFLVRPVLERLLGEIGRSLEYYRNQSHLERIDALLVTGGGANLKNISDYLSANLGLPVERVNPFDAVRFDAKRIDPQFLHLHGIAFAVALGISLPDRRRIELLPKKEPYWFKGKTERWIPGAAALLTLLAFLWIVWDTTAKVSILTKERDEKVAKAKAVEMLQTKFALLKEKESKMKAALSLFPSSTLMAVPFQSALKRIGEIVPENVTVTSLSIRPEKLPPDKAPSKEGKAPNGEYALRIEGIAFGNDFQCLTSLARLIEGLERSSLFGNAKLVSASENKSYNRPGVGFEITCEMRGEEGPRSSLSAPSPVGVTKGWPGSEGEKE